ncbi:hypothetical protein [Streptomyces sp. G45]|uniref:hypothetical protein n=1 Tax=Streptomyces sp. G45 TaxID=3406627 RepID=UPI003C17BB65
MRSTLRAQTFIDGTAYGERDVRQWELERSRAALALLKRRVGDDRMRELLAAETRAGDEVMRAAARDGRGAWCTAVTELDVEGLGAAEFLAWWQGRLAAPDRAALLAANPEHYVAASDPATGVVEIVETVGDGPLRFFLTFHDGVPIAGEGHDTYPVRVGGTGRLADGTEVCRVMHEFKDTPKGLHIRLTVQFPEGAPAHIPTGHQWHFACEFLNWAEAAKRATESAA